MYICYIDESGTPEVKGNTSHFVLAGVAIPAEKWRECDNQIDTIKSRYALQNAELHTGWMFRRYLEQERIAGFDKLTFHERRFAVEEEREKLLIRIAALRNAHQLKETKKNLAKTSPYIHLSRNERLACLRSIAELIGSWDFCRLFADAIDKTSFSGHTPKYPPYEEAFAQVISRFQRFLSSDVAQDKLGLLVQDQNETVSKRLTELMKKFHASGTMWVDIDRIIETPLFVSSALTSLVQIADITAFAIRRFFENQETDLLNKLYHRFNRVGNRLVGMRHYTGPYNRCHCRVCQEH